MYIQKSIMASSYLQMRARAFYYVLGEEEALRKCALHLWHLFESCHGTCSRALFGRSRVLLQRKIHAGHAAVDARKERQQVHVVCMSLKSVAHCLNIHWSCTTVPMGHVASNRCVPASFRIFVNKKVQSLATNASLKYNSVFSFWRRCPWVTVLSKYYHTRLSALRVIYS